MARFGSGWIPWGDDIADPSAGLGRIAEVMAQAGRTMDGFRVFGNLGIRADENGKLQLDKALEAVPAQVAAGITDFGLAVPLPKDVNEAAEVLASVASAFRARVGSRLTLDWAVLRHLEASRMSAPVQLRTGARLRSQVDTTEVIVVRAPAREVALTCGGVPMIDVKADPDASLSLDPAHSDGSPVGKRFTLPDDVTLEVLVTKGGDGSLAEGGAKLVLKEAKALPSSD